MSDAPDFEALLGEHALLFVTPDLRAGEVMEPARIQCGCGEDFGLAADDETYDAHRAHVASVLEAHTADRERALIQERDNAQRLATHYQREIKRLTRESDNAETP